MCIYFNKGLNPIKQHEFAFAIQCIFTCRTVNGDHENCDHCQRLIEKVYIYFYQRGLFQLTFAASACKYTLNCKGKAMLLNRV